ncbi:MAG: hypothetical protein EHM28_15590 [Spirochaetaceae bacterium]|nr:MAG: hypothetical protein EHM28_15590 [Spirochaetaceae bacterium]
MLTSIRGNNLKPRAGRNSLESGSVLLSMLTALILAGLCFASAAFAMIQYASSADTISKEINAQNREQNEFFQTRTIIFEKE